MDMEIMSSVDMAKTFKMTEHTHKCNMIVSLSGSHGYMRV
jgi:hypothetical protein